MVCYTHYAPPPRTAATLLLPFTARYHRTPSNALPYPSGWSDGYKTAVPFTSRTNGTAGLVGAGWHIRFVRATAAAHAAYRGIRHRWICILYLLWECVDGVDGVRTTDCLHVRCLRGCHQLMVWWVESGGPLSSSPGCSWTLVVLWICLCIHHPPPTFAARTACSAPRATPAAQRAAATTLPAHTPYAWQTFTNGSWTWLVKRRLFNCPTHFTDERMTIMQTGWFTRRAHTHPPGAPTSGTVCQIYWTLGTMV